MSLPGSPPLLSPGSGAPTPAALYRSGPDALHTSVASTGTSSPAHTNSHSHSHSLSPSPRLTSSMLSAFLPGLGNGGAAPLVSGGGAALGPLAGLGSLSSAGLTPGSPGLAQTSSNPGLCSECKLVEVHGVKVASFSVDGQELICLPQVFDLFLKHLVGGLHTVYTKLKRLDISPVVCTVEQVRVLRGLGAIQPGVNRCKLISRKDFETLYQDCTSARSVQTSSTVTCFNPRSVQTESARLQLFGFVCSDSSDFRDFSVFGTSTVSEAYFPSFFYEVWCRFPLFLWPQITQKLLILIVLLDIF